MEELVRAPLVRQVGDRIDQQLERRRRARRPSTAGEPRPRRGCRPRCRPRPRPGQDRRPARPASSIAKRTAATASSTRGGKRVLRREPVVDRQDAHACLAGEEAAGLIVGVEIADDPAAAVQVDEQRPGSGGLERHVEPGAQVAGRAGQRLLGDARDRQRRAGCGGGLAPYLVTGLGDGQRLVRAAGVRVCSRRSRSCASGSSTWPSIRHAAGTAQDPLGPRGQGGGSAQDARLEPLDGRKRARHQALSLSI